MDGSESVTISRISERRLGEVGRSDAGVPGNLLLDFHVDPILLYLGKLFLFIKRSQEDAFWAEEIGTLSVQFIDFTF